LSRRNPHRNVALVRDPDRQGADPSHARRTAQQSARHFHRRSQLVEGTQPMNKPVRLPWRIMLLLAACAPGQSALGATVQRTPVAPENPAAAPAKALEEANDAARVQPER